MSNRYLKLGIAEALTRAHRYVAACTELSFIVRYAYSNVPKNIQLLIFEDTLSAFRLLPEMQTQSAILASSILHQSAEAALPKQKRVMASVEFKHAKIAFRRREKAQKEVEGSVHVPHDVLVHIFKFLDLQSLLSVALVCRSWKPASNENSLWREQYFRFFDPCDTSTQLQGIQFQGEDSSKETAVRDDGNWKELFKLACKCTSGRQIRKRFKYNRAHCSTCDAVIWLHESKCSGWTEGMCHKVRPVSPFKVENCSSLVKIVHRGLGFHLHRLILS